MATSPVLLGFPEFGAKCPHSIAVHRSPHGTGHRSPLRTLIFALQPNLQPAPARVTVHGDAPPISRPRLGPVLRVRRAAAAAGRSRGAGEQDGAHRLGGDAAREGIPAPGLWPLKSPTALGLELAREQ